MSKGHNTYGSKIPFISNLKKLACAPEQDVLKLATLKQDVGTSTYIFIAKYSKPASRSVIISMHVLSYKLRLSLMIILDWRGDLLKNEFSLPLLNLLGAWFFSQCIYFTIKLSLQMHSFPPQNIIGTVVVAVYHQLFCIYQCKQKVFMCLLWHQQTKQLCAQCGLLQCL